MTGYELCKDYSDNIVENRFKVWKSIFHGNPVKGLSILDLVTEMAVEKFEYMEKYLKGKIYTGPH